MKTRKLALILTIAIAIMFTGSWALAVDKQVKDVAIESVTLDKDKHQKDYVRLIIPVEKNLNGISYTDTIAVNAYGAHVETAKTLKPGDMLNAIVKFREFNGNTYGTIVQFIE
jgi:hypothetical protein